LPLKGHEMCLELIQKHLVFARVTAEDFYWHEHLPTLVSLSTELFEFYSGAYYTRI